MFKVSEVDHKMKSNIPTRLCKNSQQWREKTAYIEAVCKEKILLMSTVTS